MVQGSCMSIALALAGAGYALNDPGYYIAAAVVGMFALMAILNDPRPVED